MDFKTDDNRYYLILILFDDDTTDIEYLNAELWPSDVNNSKIALIRVTLFCFHNLARPVYVTHLLVFLFNLYRKYDFMAGNYFFVYFSKYNETDKNLTDFQWMTNTFQWKHSPFKRAIIVEPR